MREIGCKGRGRGRTRTTPTSVWSRAVSQERPNVFVSR